MQTDVAARLAKAEQAIERIVPRARETRQIKEAMLTVIDLASGLLAMVAMQAPPVAVTVVPPVPAPEPIPEPVATPTHDDPAPQAAVLAPKRKPAAKKKTTRKTAKK